MEVLGLQHRAHHGHHSLVPALDDAILLGEYGVVNSRRTPSSMQ
jgi:hypothetical protein